MTKARLVLKYSYIDRYPHFLTPSLSIEKKRLPPTLDESANLPIGFQNNERQIADPLSDKSSFRVMVIDDEPDVVKVLKSGLERKGFEVDGFTDPTEALEHFKANQYNVVLTDIRMPKMDGIELYRQIRQIDSGVAICFVSAYDHYKRQFEIMHPQEQTSCFIQKPFRIDSLVSVIKSKVSSRYSS